MLYDHSNGWLVLDKSYGLTSTKAVNKIKRKLSIKKAGHLGTLDPLATGVLPVALGEATKTIPYIKNLTKKYKFIIKWGEETSTDDREGKIISESQKRPTLVEIKRVLSLYAGKMEQVPPKYSAIKINGERAYNLSRRGNMFSMPKRMIEIKSIHVTNVIDRDHTRFEVECGSGTYVRSLARDIARSLGTLGHAYLIRRTRVGQFLEKDSFAISDDKVDKKSMKVKIIPIEKVLEHMTIVELTNHKLLEKLQNGQAIKVKNLKKKFFFGEKLIIKAKGKLISIANLSDGHIVPVRNFNI